jgi:hypothetical protein
MRFRVRFAYNEQTGEVEMFRVEALTDGARAQDHDDVHDRVSGELADVVEPGAAVYEEQSRPLPSTGPGLQQQDEDRTRHETPSAETLDG